jgi:hypothetical protein
MAVLFFFCRRPLQSDAASKTVFDHNAWGRAHNKASRGWQLSGGSFP